MSRPVAIDLFAGAGGMSLGFEQAGFDVLAAVEIDPIHCAVHKFNFPNCAMIAKSAADVSAAEIREAAGLGNRDIDCVFGGPPCQGFSLIGQRAIDDPRNSLVKHFVRLVTELDARTFVFENVKGLTVGKHRAFLEELIEEFEGAGYVVRAPWRVFDVAWYGVPQHRERLILVGARKGEDLPEYPKALTVPADEASPLSDLTAGPTCRDALGDLPDADLFEILEFTDATRTTKFGSASAYASVMRCMTDDAWHLGYRRIWDPRGSLLRGGPDIPIFPGDALLRPSRERRSQFRASISLRQRDYRTHSARGLTVRAEPSLAPGQYTTH